MPLGSSTSRGGARARVSAGRVTMQVAGWRLSMRLSKALVLAIAALCALGSCSSAGLAALEQPSSHDALGAGEVWERSWSSGGRRLREQRGARRALQSATSGSSGRGDGSSTASEQTRLAALAAGGLVQRRTLSSASRRLAAEDSISDVAPGGYSLAWEWDPSTVPVGHFGGHTHGASFFSFIFNA
jgi:hypothetical protein